MTEKIVVEVSPQGKVTINAEGFSGDGCLKATQPFEEALGVPASRKEKPEIHNTQTQRNHLRE